MLLSLHLPSLLPQAAISCLAAVVMLGDGGGAASELEERPNYGRGYLGDHEALSATAARRKANSYFDTEIHTAMKLKARHNLRRKGMDARKARNDLNDFFNTLGDCARQQARDRQHTLARTLSLSLSHTHTPAPPIYLPGSVVADDC